MKLTQKQERFVLNLFKGMSQRVAYTEAGYSAKQALTTIDHHAYELANSGQVLARLEYLKTKAASDKIMDVRERKERLSEIARARITDYQTDKGIKVDSTMPNMAAIQGVETKVRYYKKGIEPDIITNLKLHNPIQAIAELNKMDRIYDDGAKVNVNFDQRQVVIQVMDAETKEAYLRLRNGEYRSQLEADGDIQAK